jgi:RNA polymerase-binding protein DksA
MARSTRKSDGADGTAADGAPGAADGATPRTATKTASATKKVTTPVSGAAPAARKAPSAAKKAVSTTKKAASTTGHAAPARRTAPPRKSPPAKKPAASKAPVSSLVVQEGEEAWTKAELAEVLGELNEQREHSLAVLRSQESELTGLMRDSGDGAGQDQADLGATSFERDHELTVVNSERDKLAQIERALGRIDDGSYGVCESCRAPIGKMRLMAFPRATLCMTCKQREERR